MAHVQSDTAVMMPNGHPERLDVPLEAPPPYTPVPNLKANRDVNNTIGESSQRARTNTSDTSTDSSESDDDFEVAPEYEGPDQEVNLDEKRRPSEGERGEIEQIESTRIQTVATSSIVDAMDDINLHGRMSQYVIHTSNFLKVLSKKPLFVSADGNMDDWVFKSEFSKATSASCSISTRDANDVAVIEFPSSFSRSAPVVRMKGFKEEIVVKSNNPYDPRASERSFAAPNGRQYIWKHDKTLNSNMTLYITEDVCSALEREHMGGNCTCKGKKQLILKGVPVATVKTIKTENGDGKKDRTREFQVRKDLIDEVLALATCLIMLQKQKERKRKQVAAATIAIL